ncbi:hypothetical protein P3T36_003815 [Kitasatospora sp. MAP12-15]|uniref:DUF397 domain-containing protein n=1 Tax=unclassified Kitasatospora TaxID=2633591 RepID=UPI0024744AA8|nr:DUF397 domain-containing protein [Kitasatospora sp. MAP12-44]MDH6112404.1 hypothetical protein [Kitasatospora sp. MAP12-44]
MSSPDIVSSFRKSSYSQQGGECVETARTVANGQAVRDSKDLHGPVLSFPADAWCAFVAAIKVGDLPSV